MPSTNEGPPMAVPRDPTSAEIARFLATRSTNQMLRLVADVREPMAQWRLTEAMLHLPPVVVATSAPPEKAKKALNAFVGFRCFYITIPILKPWPMKKLSNLMGVLWDRDPNKALWSLMAKAWSTIRDQVGKNNAPLDLFFQIVCPYLNIPSPEVYLEVYGWTLGSDNDGNPALSKLLPQSEKTAGPGSGATGISVEDIVNRCQLMGYAQEYKFDSETNSPTFLAQPGNNTSPPVNPETQPEPPAYQDRLVARNDRRARRGTARDTGVAALLRQQVTNAHIANGARPVAPASGHDEPVQFHDDLADLLTNHMGQAQQDIAGQPVDLPAAGQAQQDIVEEPFDFLAAGDPIMNGWTDWGAFRLGADEDATLPIFDIPTL